VIAALLLSLCLAVAAPTLDPGGKAASASADPWSTTLERVAPSVVTVKISRPRAFDTGAPSTSYATGFVVDAARGLLLTNRHVPGPGPVSLRLVFQNNEEVEAQVVYRDPIHDFSLLRFDPAGLRHQPGLRAIPLFPEGAVVGAEIRVVGNDAGEKLSFLSGTIARTNRDAPTYDRRGYNDFNTFYIQAASGTSGGSSGSPVIDQQGRALALNAGGQTKAASSYFLPLDRVVRALELIQRGQPVTRGTVQATFAYEPFNEARRLGLSAAAEDRLRASDPGATGVLVVRDLLPEGPADGRLRPGDVLLAVEGQPVPGFVPLEGQMDAAVGRDLQFTVERGGKPITVDLTIQDLHAITPAELLEVGGGVLHPLSYQQARNFGVPVKGVYLAGGGFSFTAAGLEVGSLLTEVNGQPIPNLDALERVLATLPHGSRVPVRVVDLDAPRESQVQILTLDRRWYPTRRCRLDAASGRWPCVELPPAPKAPVEAAQVAPALVHKGRAERRLAQSFVVASFQIPYRTDGVYGASFRGVGVVVDAERGLVVVDRDTVPVALGELTLTFGGAVQIPGEVLWLHPQHNLALVRYDPARIAGTPVRALRFVEAPLEVGDTVWQVGLSARNEMVSRRTRVERSDPLVLPIGSPPSFRDTNTVVYDLRGSALSAGGVVIDRWGRGRALWASFVNLSGERPQGTLRGLPAEHIVLALQAEAAGKADPWPMLGAELGTLGFNEAEDLGLSAEARALLLDAAPRQRRVLQVIRLAPGSAAAGALREGDLILSVNGAAATSASQVDGAARLGAVELGLLREGRPQQVRLSPQAESAKGTRRALLWAGALVQPVPYTVSAQSGVPRSGVYVAWSWYGSPVASGRLNPTRRITAIDGEPIADLDAFLGMVRGRPAGSVVRVTSEDLDGRVLVQTVVMDPLDWPTEEITYGAEGWVRRPL